MGIKNGQASGQRLLGMEEDCVGSEGSRIVALAGEEEEKYNNNNNNNITRTVNCNYRIAAMLYTLERWFVSGI